jgi:hypothetical protein
VSAPTTTTTRGIVFLLGGVVVGVAVSRQLFPRVRSEVIPDEFFDAAIAEGERGGDGGGGSTFESLGVTRVVPTIPREDEGDTFNIFDLAGIDSAVGRFNR